MSRFVRPMVIRGTLLTVSAEGCARRPGGATRLGTVMVMVKCRRFAGVGACRTACRGRMGVRNVTRPGVPSPQPFWWRRESCAVGPWKLPGVPTVKVVAFVW